MSREVTVVKRWDDDQYRGAIETAACVVIPLFDYCKLISHTKLLNGNFKRHLTLISIHQWQVIRYSYCSAAIPLKTEKILHFSIKKYKICKSLFPKIINLFDIPFVQLIF